MKEEEQEEDMCVGNASNDEQRRMCFCAREAGRLGVCGGKGFVTYLRTKQVKTKEVRRVLPELRM